MNSYGAYSNSPYKSTKHSTYFPVYDKLFSRFIGKAITFVEIGVLNGGSLFMWREFLGPNARIIGIDLNPDAKRWENDGFEIYIGSQSDPTFWHNFFSAVGPVDLVLDDGGHTFEQQIITAESVVPFINDGGLLVVEDTHTSYLSEFSGPSSRSFVSYAKNCVDGINHRFGKLAEKKPSEGVIYSLQFFESFVVFDINRQLCELPSVRTGNRGESIGAEDFRYADSPLIERLTNTSEQLLSQKKSSFRQALGRFLKDTLSGRIMRLVNYRRNRSLRRYFRY